MMEMIADPAKAGEAAQARALWGWYAEHGGQRGLPWRQAGCPPDVRALVEGLLAQTGAEVVAEHFPRVFAGVERAPDWLALSVPERRARVAPLGLPAMKVAAVTSIAEHLQSGGMGVPLELSPGVGPYIAGMVALLLGAEAVPVDTNVQRVGGRVPAHGDAGRWMAGLVAEAMLLPPGGGLPAAYCVVSAVLDVGATLCGPWVRSCPRCPLRPACAYREHYGEQLDLFPSRLYAEFR